MAKDENKGAKMSDEEMSDRVIRLAFDGDR